MRNRIYLCLAHMSGEEQKFIQEAFDTNWVVPLGPNVNGFEADLEAFVGEDKRVVALSAGTAAVHLALIACGVQAEKRRERKMENIENLDKAIEETMKLFRKSPEWEDHRKEENELMARVALANARGDITIRIKDKTGEKKTVELHCLGNAAAMAVGAFSLLDRIVEKSPGLTFDDVIMWMRYMEERKNDTAGAGEDSE